MKMMRDNFFPMKALFYTQKAKPPNGQKSFCLIEWRDTKENLMGVSSEKPEMTPRHSA
jgi:hypothetical protein